MLVYILYYFLNFIIIIGLISAKYINSLLQSNEFHLFIRSTQFSFSFPIWHRHQNRIWLKCVFVCLFVYWWFLPRSSHIAGKLQSLKYVHQTSCPPLLLPLLLWSEWIPPLHIIQSIQCKLVVPTSLHNPRALTEWNIIEDDLQASTPIKAND